MLMVFDADHHEIKQSMIFSDCALVVNPTAEQLAEIAIASTQSGKRMLDEEPRVAMLSFSTNGSANHEMVDKVREATNLVKQALPDLAIDGEIQLDAAIVRSGAPSATGVSTMIIGLPLPKESLSQYQLPSGSRTIRVVSTLLMQLSQSALVCVGLYNGLAASCSAISLESQAEKSKQLIASRNENL